MKQPVRSSTHWYDNCVLQNCPPNVLMISLLWLLVEKPVELNHIVEHMSLSVYFRLESGWFITNYESIPVMYTSGYILVYETFLDDIRHARLNFMGNKCWYAM